VLGAPGRKRRTGSRTAEPSSDWHIEALAGSRAQNFWTDGASRTRARRLGGAIDADLTIIGAGFTGLWAAVQALEDDPERSVVVLEAERVGFGASSRNGGFCDSSLTHGLHNGLAHWPNEAAALRKLGRENLDAIEATLLRHHVDAGFERVGEIAVATEQWHLAELSEGLAAHLRAGDDVELLDQATMRSLVNSPTYLGGLFLRNDVALVDPARLCWGLLSIAESLGAVVYEQSPVMAVDRVDVGLAVTTREGSVRTQRVVSATNAYRSPVRRARRYTVPIYDHVLMTEPLSADQFRSIGWGGRQGISDAANQFHYCRLTADNRILWGGYDATYHFNNGLHPKFDESPETHSLLARHFFETFPQLEGLRFTHRWGGPIATTTRFTATWGQAHDGDLVWVGGYTGLGVGASRFGARVALDLVDGRETERTELAMVRRKPMAFPPEPVRSVVIGATRRAIQRSDTREGRRGPWLKLLDRFGVGFDS